MANKDIQKSIEGCSFSICFTLDSPLDLTAMIVSALLFFGDCVGLLWDHFVRWQRVVDPDVVEEAFFTGRKRNPSICTASICRGGPQADGTRPFLSVSRLSASANRSVTSANRPQAATSAGG